jgi:hypothetical protein
MVELQRAVAVFRSNWQILVPVIIVVIFLVIERTIHHQESPRWLWFIFGGLGLVLVGGGAYLKRYGYAVVGIGFLVVAIVLALNIAGLAFWFWVLLALVIVLAGALIARE